MIPKGLTARLWAALDRWRATRAPTDCHARDQGAIRRSPAVRLSPHLRRDIGLEEP